MFWADAILLRFLEKRTQSDSSLPVVIRDEKTASGRVHVGSMRGVALHGILSLLLKEKGISNAFLYEINDFDAFDSVPVYLDPSFKEHLGKPLFSVPSPDGSAENYAAYFGGEFRGVIEEAGFTPSFYFSSEAYRSGKYNEVIRIALERASDIRRIYKEISGGERDSSWLPIMMVCERCGKVATTKALSFDGEKVHYICSENPAQALSCGYEGEAAPYDGRAKLPWKVEWAAKFKVFGVQIEAEGKDLSTKGGARDVANHIAREVFAYEPPFDAPYEFLLVGGRKMSTSKGAGSSAREVALLLPKKLLRLMLLGKDLRKAVNFDPGGDTIPVLYDQYDKIAEKSWGGTEDDDSRLFSLIHEGGAPTRHFLPRFSQIAFLVQMPHLSLADEAERMKGAPLREEDIRELEERARYARQWIEMYAPEEFRFELQRTSVPEEAKHFSEGQKEVLRKIRSYVAEKETLDGQELHTYLHELRKESGLSPEEFFGALYRSFLGKESGPKAGWFLSVIDRQFLLSRLEEVSS